MTQIQDFNLLIGQKAELRVRDWYVKVRGARLLSQNFRCKGGELDLVVEELNQSGPCVLVFVEVRVRRGSGWISGLESVSPKKEKCLRKAASHFLSQYQGNAEEVRFDLVTWNGQEWSYFSNFLGN